MNKDIDYVALGTRVREIRRRKNLSQEKLSAMVDVSTRYISNIELANSKIGLQTLIALANALEVTVDELLYDSTPAIQAQFDLEAKQIMDDCTSEERHFLLDLMRHAKEDLRKNIR